MTHQSGLTKPCWEDGTLKELQDYTVGECQAMLDPRWERLRLVAALDTNTNTTIVVQTGPSARHMVEVLEHIDTLHILKISLTISMLRKGCLNLPPTDRLGDEDLTRNELLADAAQDLRDFCKHMVNRIAVNIAPARRIAKAPAPFSADFSNTHSQLSQFDSATMLARR